MSIFSLFGGKEIKKFKCIQIPWKIPNILIVLFQKKNEKNLFGHFGPVCAFSWQNSHPNELVYDVKPGNASRVESSQVESSRVQLSRFESDYSRQGGQPGIVESSRVE